MQSPTSILGNTPDKPYFLFMETTNVEERLTRIEREFDELKHEVLGLKPRAKGWRQTVGAIQALHFNILGQYHQPDDT
jgi:hypothetical protein